MELQAEGVICLKGQMNLEIGPYTISYYHNSIWSMDHRTFNARLALEVSAAIVDEVPRLGPFNDPRFKYNLK